MEEIGEVSAEQAVDDALEQDLKTAETLSVPITLAILVVAFGALAAAGIPVILALTAVLATMGLAGLVSHITPVDDATSNLIVERPAPSRGCGRRSCSPCCAGPRLRRSWLPVSSWPSRCRRLGSRPGTPRRRRCRRGSR